MSSDWQDIPVLVTGAGGFIGSHLVEALVISGARVRAFVRYNSRNDIGLLRYLPEELLKQVEIIPGDLRDAGALRQAVRGAQVVFHLGAIIAIPYSYIHPLEVVESNVLGTINMLLACRAEKVARLVHTSSSEVYGTARHVPMDENHPLQGQSPYSASKIGADKLAESFFLAYDLPVVTLRPFNTYGPRQSARAVIPAIISQALSGGVVRLGNLAAWRDFTYIRDTVAGFLQAGSVPGIEGKTINLGSGEELRIADVVSRVEALLESKLTVILDEERLRPEASEVQRLLSDNRLAQELLDWKPRVAFDQGLKETLQWVKSHLDLYKPGEYEI